MMIMSEIYNELEYKKRLINLFSSFKLKKRNDLMLKVLSERTRYITVGLENIYQPHNASAVLRSCDCFGIQDVHIIENSYRYEVNPHVSLGAAQWLNLNLYNETDNNTASCISKLKSKGYRIVATSPSAEAVSVYNFDIKKGPFCLLFGTEKFGLSDEAFSAADELVSIPMYGFTESFNISVSASLCLFHFTERLRKENVSWQLSEYEQSDILLQWYRNTIPQSDAIESQFVRDNQ